MLLGLFCWSSGLIIGGVGCGMGLTLGGLGVDFPELELNEVECMDVLAILSLFIFNNLLISSSSAFILLCCVALSF